MTPVEFALALAVSVDAAMGTSILWGWNYSLVYAVCLTLIVVPTVAYRQWKKRKGKDV